MLTSTGNAYTMGKKLNFEIDQDIPGPGAYVNKTN